jgi:hypothetical protein
MMRRGRGKTGGRGQGGEERRGRTVGRGKEGEEGGRGKEGEERRGRTGGRGEEREDMRESIRGRDHVSGGQLFSSGPRSSHDWPPNRIILVIQRLPPPHAEDRSPVVDHLQPTQSTGPLC